MGPTPQPQVSFVLAGTKPLMPMKNPKDAAQFVTVTCNEAGPQDKLLSEKARWGGGKQGKGHWEYNSTICVCVF